MDLHGKSLLAGQAGATGGATYSAINPATGEILSPPFHEAAATEVDAALQAAADAFEDYRARPAETRARLLETIAMEIEALGDELLQRTQPELAARAGAVGLQGR